MTRALLLAMVLAIAGCVSVCPTDTTARRCATGNCTPFAIGECR